MPQPFNPLGDAFTHDLIGRGLSPAPWRPAAAGDGVSLYVLDAGRRRVCVFKADARDWHNAQLVALAPVMLAALRLVLRNADLAAEGAAEQSPARVRSILQTVPHWPGVEAARAIVAELERAGVC